MLHQIYEAKLITTKKAFPSQLPAFDKLRQQKGFSLQSLTHGNI